MRRILFLSLSGFIFLTGCETPATPDKESGVDVETEKVGIISKEGEVCGGTEGQRCETGLECQFDGTKSGGEGTCAKSIVDDELECPETKAPVCGLKGRVKNGYLNECEARRHGAEIISERFCKKDETVTNNCEAVVKALGNCDTVLTGYEASDGKCKAFSVTACDAEIPFATLEGCKTKCE